MNSETKQCQNCHKDFTIEPDDFLFYEKIKVPPPTWCFECRTMRRIQFRNERSLYSFTCALCGKKGISMYNEKNIFPTYCIDCWYSDNWNPLGYAQDYNFSKNFFEQVRNLLDKVPRPNLFIRNSSNSKYTNIISDCKNVYLSYSVTFIYFL